MNDSRAPLYCMLALIVFPWLLLAALHVRPAPCGDALLDYQGLSRR